MGAGAGRVSCHEPAATLLAMQMFSLKFPFALRRFISPEMTW